MLAELVSAARRATAAAATSASLAAAAHGDLGNGSVRAIEAVLDHSSFATTVENLFSLSFLIRDGHVSLSDSAEGYRVKAVKRSGAGGAKGAAAAGHPSPPGAGAAGGGTDAANASNTNSQHQLQHRQLVLAYSMRDFEDWKRAVDPRDCLMPKHQASLSGSAPASVAARAPAAAAAAAAAVASRAPSAVGADPVKVENGVCNGSGRGRAGRPRVDRLPPPPLPLASPTQPAPKTGAAARPPAAARASASKKRSAAAAVSEESSSDDGEEEGEEEDSPARKRRRGSVGGGGPGLGGPKEGGKGGRMLRSPRPARRG